MTKKKRQKGGGKKYKVKCSHTEDENTYSCDVDDEADDVASEADIEESARRVQALARGRAARKKLADQQLKQKAAATIQEAWQRRPKREAAP